MGNSRGLYYGCVNYSCFQIAIAISTASSKMTQIRACKTSGTAGIHRRVKSMPEKPDAVIRQRLVVFHHVSPRDRSAALVLSSGSDIADSTTLRVTFRGADYPHVQNQ